MNHFVKMTSIVFCFMQVAIASQIKFERVIEPDFALYEPLFFKFGYTFCADYCGQAALNQILDYAFYQESLAYFDQDASRVFVQAVFFDEIIGYMSCQIMPDHRLRIHHLIIDPELYDDAIVKDFLFLLLEIMPKVKQISVRVPICCADLTDLLQELGFVCDDPLYTIDETGLADAILYVEYSLKVHSKCAMCNVLYGPNFWNMDEDFVVVESDVDDEEEDDEVAVNPSVCPQEVICPEEEDICSLSEK